ncbi:MAG: tail fiber domain-containing protein [Pyrinomonadaceae bacterium]
MEKRASTVLAKLAWKMVIVIAFGAVTVSAQYILDQTTLQTANFNISGTGKANIFDASTQYNLQGNRMLGMSGFENMFGGIGAGAANTTGLRNTAFGKNAGYLNTTGSGNSFFGAYAGERTTGGSNSFFGENAGSDNTFGAGNSFFGSLAGWLSTTGNHNSFFGNGAGQQNTTGHNNSFFGYRSGQNNTLGRYNSFFGYSAGEDNNGGEYNVFIGTDAGSLSTDGNYNSFLGISSGLSNTTGNNNTLVGAIANVGAGNLTYATAIGSGAVALTSNSVYLGRSSDIVYIPGYLRLSQLGGAGTTPLCRNNANTIGACSSSLRYKANIGRFSLGLSLIDQLKPITFDWKDGGMHDLGLGAEDVAAIEPLLVTYNDKGEVEGVKYDRIGVVLINAIKEQQQMIANQQTEIDALRSLVCGGRKQSQVCKGASK